MKGWTIPVKEDPETGEMLIEFPDDILAAVGWKAGDSIKWDIQADGTCILTRIEKKDDQAL